MRKPNRGERKPNSLKPWLAWIEKTAELISGLKRR